MTADHMIGMMEGWMIGMTDEETTMDNTNREHVDPAPESAMGGASDAGAHGRHPVSAPALKREHLPLDPDAAIGDAPIERRRGSDPNYRGKERRMARR